ncbi:MAG TPA: class I SAM-dependent methyltransferase [Thermoleophilaceae bacterium]|nr:class I SAM-dependent methyltransferase [Thermoleophilaceae bacterium]
MTAAPTCWLCDAPTSPCAALAPLPFRSCERCGFVFRPDLSETARAIYEDSAYEGTHGEIYTSPEYMRARDSDAAVRLRFLRGHAQGGDLLDVGASAGNFTAAAARAGFRARGVEPTPGFARVARELLGTDVATGTIEDLDLPERSLDVVTMWHVLEHIPHPTRELRRIRAALRPSGVLAIEVPNAGGVAARTDGTAWGSLEPDVHVNQFAPETLRLALERAGFAIAVIETVPITPYLPPRRRLAPRHLAARAKAALRAGGLRGRHPHAHELLRAVATPAER